MQELLAGLIPDRRVVPALLDPTYQHLCAEARTIYVQIPGDFSAGDVQCWRAVLLSFKLNPYRTFIFHRRLHHGWNYRGIVVLKVSLNSWCCCVNGKRKLKGGNRLRIPNVSIILQDLQECVIELFIRSIIQKMAFRNPV